MSFSRKILGLVLIVFLTHTHVELNSAVKTETTQRIEKLTSLVDKKDQISGVVDEYASKLENKAKAINNQKISLFISKALEVLWDRDEKYNSYQDNVYESIQNTIRTRLIDNPNITIDATIKSEFDKKIQEKQDEWFNQYYKSELGDCTNFFAKDRYSLGNELLRKTSISSDVVIFLTIRREDSIDKKDLNFRKFEDLINRSGVIFLRKLITDKNSQNFLVDFIEPIEKIMNAILLTSRAVEKKIKKEEGFTESSEEEVSKEKNFFKILHSCLVNVYGIDSFIKNNPVSLIIDYTDLDQKREAFIDLLRPSMYQTLKGMLFSSNSNEDVHQILRERLKKYVDENKPQLISQVTEIYSYDIQKCELLEKEIEKIFEKYEGFLRNNPTVNDSGDFLSEKLKYYFSWIMPMLQLTQMMHGTATNVTKPVENEFTDTHLGLYEDIIKEADRNYPGLYDHVVGGLKGVANEKVGHQIRALINDYAAAMGKAELDYSKNHPDVFFSRSGGRILAGGQDVTGVLKAKAQNIVQQNILSSPQEVHNQEGKSVLKEVNIPQPTHLFDPEQKIIQQATITPLDDLKTALEALKAKLAALATALKS